MVVVVVVLASEVCAVCADNAVPGSDEYCAVASGGVGATALVLVGRLALATGALLPSGGLTGCATAPICGTSGLLEAEAAVSPAMLIAADPAVPALLSDGVPAENASLLICAVALAGDNVAGKLSEPAAGPAESAVLSDDAPAGDAALLICAVALEGEKAAGTVCPDSVFIEGSTGATTANPARGKTSLSEPSRSMSDTSGSRREGVSVEGMRLPPSAKLLCWLENIGLTPNR